MQGLEICHWGLARSQRKVVFFLMIVSCYGSEVLYLLELYASAPLAARSE